MNLHRSGSRALRGSLLHALCGRLQQYIIPTLRPVPLGRPSSLIDWHPSLQSRDTKTKKKPTAKTRLRTSAQGKPKAKQRAKGCKGRERQQGDKAKRTTGEKTSKKGKRRKKQRNLSKANRRARTKQTEVENEGNELKAKEPQRKASVENKQENKKQEKGDRSLTPSNRSSEDGQNRETETGAQYPNQGNPDKIERKQKSIMEYLTKITDATRAEDKQHVEATKDNRDSNKKTEEKATRETEEEMNKGPQKKTAVQ